MRRDIDQEIAAIAAGQAGAVGRRQIYGLGGNRALVERRIVSGALGERSENVLVVPSHPESFHQRLWVAVLDSEAGAAVSHESAGRISRLETFAVERRAVLTVPHGDNRSRLADRVHQTRYPPTPVLVDGLPVTTVARTIVDLGRVLRPGRLEAVFEDALRRRLVRTSEVEQEWLEAWSRWPWRLQALNEILASRRPGYRPTKSDVERILRELVMDIPGVSFEAPFPGVELPGCCVDCLFKLERVILEVDGRDWHTRRADFVRDRQRDRAASRAGFLPVRFAAEEVEDDCAGIRAEVEGILAQRRLDLGLAA